MSDILCSVLLPTRKRVARLDHTIASILTTVGDPWRIEIIVRVDEDDTETIAALTERKLTLSPPFWTEFTKIIIGPRPARGYADLNLLYQEMCKVARGKWIWIFNDDATIERDGRAWDDLLAEIPTEGLIVQPGTDQFNLSKYTGKEGGPFPIVPLWSWGRDPIPDPIDIKVDEALRGGLGWKTAWLEGVTVNHQRDSDEALTEHRRLDR